jgi:N-acetylneuraminate lyase
VNAAVKPIHPLHGLVAAPFAPLAADGTLDLARIEKQAEHLARCGVRMVFVNGTTGECTSLTLDERRAIARRWCEVTRGSDLHVAVHVGTNCLADSRLLAAEAEACGAASISAFAPSYFRPQHLNALIDWCASIAAAAPELPFYFYDIPSFTHVALSMPQFLEQAPARIPNLAGLKFTNPDLMAYQLCLRASGGRFDVAYGCDEWLLAALALGARGAVGSTYNFAAPVYRRMWAAFTEGNWEVARSEQFRAVQLIQLLAGYGFLPAAKATMELVGVEVGPVRPPQNPLTAEQRLRLREDLEKLGFFDWIP